MEQFDPTELSPQDELRLMEAETNDDGTVNVEISHWTYNENEYGQDTVEVTAITPTRDTFTEEMDWPQAGPELTEYKFYQLVRSCGLEMDEVNRLDGQDVLAERDAGWSLRAEWDDKSWRDYISIAQLKHRAVQSLCIAIVFGWYVMLLALAILLVVMIL
jgi:hypothetical protein